MCKCRILIEADLDGYILDNMMLEEMALQDVIQATTDDFACVVDKLKRNPNNLHLLHHAYELMQFMQTDNSFCLSDMDTDTYIEMMLASAGLSVKDTGKCISQQNTFSKYEWRYNRQNSIRFGGIYASKKRQFIVQ